MNAKKKTEAKKTANPSPRPITHLGFTIHDEAVMRRIGAEVRRIRTERGLYLSQVAEGAGVSIGFLSDCERGRRALTGATLGAVAQALGRDVDVVDLVLLAGACTRCCGSGVEPDDLPRGGGLLGATARGIVKDYERGEAKKRTSAKAVG